MAAKWEAAHRLRVELVVMAWRDRALYAIAATVFATAFLVWPTTGRRPDWEIALSLIVKLATAGVVLVLGLIVWKLVWLALVARSRRPLRDFAGWIIGFFTAPGLLPTVLHTLTIFFLYAGGFAVLKGAIAVVSPFAWDARLAALDRALHFGAQPHEWLLPLTPDWVLKALNIGYNFWFFALVMGWIAAACATRRTGLRHQYVMSFMLTWFVGGFLVALSFSSAGPCYYARVGLGDLYEPLMRALHAADGRHEIWALTTQDLLWDGFTGERRGSAGISAFPSMHVATATLFALAARQLGPVAFAVGVAYWVMIMLGSVLLAWHYAVDGYAATLIAMGAWLAAGAYRRQVLGDAYRTAAAA